MVENILEQIRNGEIAVEDGDGRFPVHPLNSLLQHGLTIVNVYGFNQ